MADPGVGVAVAIAIFILRVVIRLAVRSRREEQFANAAPELDDATRRMLATPSLDARAETDALSRGGDAGSIFLFDVEGDLAIDGGAPISFPAQEKKAEPAGSYREPTARGTGRVVAVLRVPPGRHSILVRNAGRMVTASVFLHPKELWGRRVAAGEGDWEEATSGEIETARQDIVDGKTKVVDYADGVLPGVNAVIAVEIRVKRTITLFTKAVASLANQAEVFRLKTEMIKELDAAGLSAERTEMLVSGLGNVIWETRSRGSGALQRAVAASELALAVLPDEPRLLALLGETEKALGRDEHAKEHLSLALDRGKALGAAALDATWTARVEAALAA